MADREIIMVGRRQRALKLLALTVAAVGVVAGLLRPDPLEAVPDVALAIAGGVLGLAAAGWAAVRALRVGNRWPREALGEVDAADRRMVRRAWRTPDAVPHRLRHVTRRYAIAQHEANDRIGWIAASIVLVSLGGSTSGWIGIAVRLFTLVITAGLGFGSDLVAARWKRVQIALLESTEAPVTPTADSDA